MNTFILLNQLFTIDRVFITGIRFHLRVPLKELHCVDLFKLWLNEELKLA